MPVIVAIFIPLAVLSALHLLVALRLWQISDRVDSRILFDAVDRLRSGLPLYRPGILDEHTKPPLTTFMLWPLGELPRWLVQLGWDLANFALPLVLGIALLRCLETERLSGKKRLGILALALTLGVNAWYWEAQLGQYNLLLLGLLVAAIAVDGRCRSRMSAIGTGLVFAIAVLMKPTNLIYAPLLWMGAGAGSKRLRWKLMSFVSFPIALAAGYVARFGFERMVSDHLAWLHSVQLTTARVIGRPENMGLSSFGGSTVAWLVGGTMAGGAATYLLARRSRPAGRRWLWLLGLLGWLGIATSAMGWFQNFVLLLPLYVLMAEAVLEGRTRAWTWERVVLWGAVILQLVGLVLQPKVVGRETYESLAHAKFWLWPPLLGLVAVWPQCKNIINLVIDKVNREGVL